MQVLILTALALSAFAGNSLICRLAFTTTQVDAATFTAVRLISGAAVLAVIAAAQRQSPVGYGSWTSAAALFLYAASFSFAYLSLTAGTGALVLFGSVQLTMIGAARLRGDLLVPVQWIGIALAIGGLIVLLRPGLAAPSPTGALLMAVAGISWGVYSLRGREVTQPLAATSGNFARSIPLVLCLVAVCTHNRSWDGRGVLLACCSGGITSGLGYVIWYAAVRQLSAITAAIVQLAVPIITAIAAALLVHEPLTLRLGLSATAVLGGILLVILRPDWQRFRPGRPATPE